MNDPKVEMILALVQYFAYQQRLYLKGYKSVWGYGEHHMAEYLMSPFRRIKP